MARDGQKILDSDMHVFEPHDLYLKYMNPKWGDRIPRGEPRKRHGQIKFSLANGKPKTPEPNIQLLTGMKMLLPIGMVKVRSTELPNEPARNHTGPS